MTDFDEKNGVGDANDVPFEVARLTPIGRGAVACVGVRGAGAWRALRERWRRADGRESSSSFDVWTPEASERPFFGHFLLDDAAAEEIVLRRRTASAFELNGHGGDFVSSAIVRFFVERGATQVSGDRWERGVERQKMKSVAKNNATRRLDETFFAAADALTTATTTETTAKIALDQRVAWRDWFDELANELASLSEGAVESTGERKAEFAARWKLTISKIAQKYELGRHLTAPFVVLLTGVPNAGKSSLLNAALGFDRVVVSSTFGTTRDLVGATKIVGGWSFRFVDAAGLRDATDPIEKEGTRLAVDAASRADVVVRVFDATLGRREQEEIFERFFDKKNNKSFATAAVDPIETRRKSRIINVVNKIDLPIKLRNADWNDFSVDAASLENSETRRTAASGKVGKIGEVERFLSTSAKFGRGVDAFFDAIFNATVGAFGVEKDGRSAVESTRPSETLPWNVEQLAFLQELSVAIGAGSLKKALKTIRSFD